MAEIEITLPTVQYGNVKVRATPEELGVDIASPAAVGTATAIYLNLFLQGWATGSSMDVTASPTEGLKAPQGADDALLASPELQESLAQMRRGERSPALTREEEAAQILADGLGGATELDDDAAPWDKPAVATPAKPWETSGGSPAAEW